MTPEQKSVIKVLNRLQREGHIIESEYFSLLDFVTKGYTLDYDSIINIKNEKKSKS